MSLLPSLLRRIDKTPTCWLWTSHIRSDGYGTFTQRVDGRITPQYPHRLMYETTVGPIPDGYQIDHLCRVRHCVNPAHLEAVPPRENYLRGIGATAVNARKTECIHGHAFTPENTYHRPTGGRSCRECDRAKLRRRRARTRQENAA